MSEYAVILAAAAGVDNSIILPTGAIVRGVYASTGTMTIKWNFNGTIGTIVAATAFWEPSNGFAPAPFSSILVNPSAACDVTVRYEVRA